MGNAFSGIKSLINCIVASSGMLVNKLVMSKDIIRATQSHKSHIFLRDSDSKGNHNATNFSL